MIKGLHYYGNVLHFWFAQAYGSGAYSSCPYNGCTATNTTTNTTNVLTNTGFMIAAIVTLACLIIVGAIFVRWWRRSTGNKPTSANQTVSRDAKERKDDRNR
ncbi:MAG TPA: hypothetical protein VGS08_04655 [Candidatus Saccharimonadales bacterium]|nr:hypothetical protein [Candidatus Saccharimonadales bacterium]